MSHITLKKNIFIGNKNKISKEVFCFGFANWAKKKQKQQQINKNNI